MLREFRFPAGDDFAISPKGFAGGHFPVLLIKLHDLHSLLCNFRTVELMQAMEHIIRPPIAADFIKQTPNLHDLFMFTNVAYVS